MGKSDVTLDFASGRQQQEAGSIWTVFSACTSAPKGFSDGATGKESSGQCRRHGLDPLEKGMATHSSYSCLGNPMDRGAWQVIVHGVVESQT